jgi:hypothetical protein
MSLSELAIKKAQPNPVENSKSNPKPYWMKDEHGLYLEIHHTGKKVWKLRYWIAGKEGKIKLGEYPLMSLKDARTARYEARKQVADQPESGTPDNPGLGSEALCSHPAVRKST